MSLLNDIISRSRVYFPDLDIKYKDKSILMKILSIILFFNRNFMNYTTTFGSTVYFTSESKVKNFPISNSIIFLHELSHIYESKKNSIFFKISYLFPQILSILSIPMFILFGIKAAVLCLLFLLPLPAYFRMKEERKAYIISLYVMNKINQSHNFNINLDAHKDNFIREFSGWGYYLMWPLPGIKASFDEALEKIKLGENPTEDFALFNIIDDILKKQ